MKLIKQILVFTWLKLFEIFKFILVGCWYVSFWGSIVTLGCLISYGAGFIIIKVFGIDQSKGGCGRIEACAFLGFISLVALYILYDLFSTKPVKRWIKKNWKEAGRIVEKK